MSIKASVLSTLLGLLITTGPTFGQSSTGKTWQVLCSDFEGVRAHFVTNPMVSAAKRNRLMRGEDEISGLKMDLTFSTASTEGNVTTYGNVNVGGGVFSFSVVRLTGALLSFIGHDPIDGSTNLLTLFPEQHRIIWTMHTDRIGYWDQMALGKTYMGKCARR